MMNKLLGLPMQASEHGVLLDQMLELLHWVMALLFVGWSIFFLYTLFKFRHKKDGKADYHGVRSHASSHLEMGVVIVEAILLLGFAIPLWAVRTNEFPTGPDVQRVRAVGQQFFWTFHYPGEDGRFGRVDPNLMTASNPLGLDSEDPNAEDDLSVGELVLQVDKSVIVNITSKDVIHNLALIELRIAQDAIPGMEIPMWFKPIKTGDYEIVCGQLCGPLHANMVGKCRVLEEKEFEEWKKEMLTLKGT